MLRHPAEIIQRKRDGAELVEGEIRDLVAGVVDGAVGDAQLGAFLMAVCCRGMTTAETTALTLAMRDSGVVLDLSGIPGRKIDKHSTGGVGDKVSLVLAPLVAAAGVPVPMISGRGLGHTGGTLDKLAAIPGYRTDLPVAEFRRVLAAAGYVMAGPTDELAPADRRMYAVRDVSGTVESIPLITSSILSKKLASGLDGLVMDVKVGRASLVGSRDRAARLRDSLVQVGGAAGKPVRVLLTDMDTPLGLAIGNALEVQEALASLRGGGPPDLRELVLALGTEMLIMAGVAADPAPARTLLVERLDGGAALQAMVRNLELQGGDPRVVDEPARLPRAPVVQELPAPASGYVADLDPLALGQVMVRLGGGRRQPTDGIDPAVGLVLRRRRGEAVSAGEPWIEVHAASAAAAAAVADQLAAALVVAAQPPAPTGVVLEPA